MNKKKINLSINEVNKLLILATPLILCFLL